MTYKPDKSDVSKQIYDLFKLYYKNYKEFIQLETYKEKSSTIYKGYFIKSELLNDFKNKILYEKLIENNFGENNSYNASKKLIEKYCENKKIKRFVAQTKFNKADDLIKALENQTFDIINENLWKGICKENLNDEKNGINFKIEKNKMILIFEDGQKLYFKLKDKNNCIIEKALLINNEESVIKKDCTRP